MTQVPVKTEQTYEIVTLAGQFVAVVLPYREGRLPIKKTVINSSLCVELTCADDTIEVLGRPFQPAYDGHPAMPARPFPESLIEMLRTHHEGMLLVELYEADDPRAAGFAPGAPPVAGEQKLRAPLMKPA